MSVNITTKTPSSSLSTATRSSSGIWMCPFFVNSRNVLALSLCWGPLSEPPLPLWQLDKPGCDSFVQPCLCSWRSHMDWTSQTSSQGIPESSAGTGVISGAASLCWTKDLGGHWRGKKILPVSPSSLMSGFSWGWVRTVKYSCLSFHWVSQLLFPLVYLGVLFSLPFLKARSLSKCCVCFSLKLILSLNKVAV